ncbi:MAG TPA: 3-dehydroquinate synthase, partial [Candidatus Micrarchaeota archaeon]|nr:3-dehydroquinate synthase [Candidatus Micrarchaeota archaeon]
AEVIKAACIADATLFAYLEENLKQAMDLKKSVIEKVMHDSIAVKTAIVEKDESEKNERMKLNFGHTVGHSIENTLGIRHGESVAIGMMVAAGLSQKRGFASQKDCDRLQALLEKAGLPVRLPGKSKENLGKIKDALSKDKKKRGSAIRMALMGGIGKARVEEVQISEIEGVLDDLC